MFEKEKCCLVVIALGVALPLAAQVQIEKRRPAPANTVVEIENSFGSVVVRGWEQNEVLVRGELAPGARGLDLDGDGDEIYIDIDEPDHWFYAPSEDAEFRSRLEIMVPAGASVDIETVNASIDVAGVNGAVELESVNGDISVVGRPQVVDVETMTGSVAVSAEGAPMTIESITGTVTVEGASREVDVESVEGAVVVTGRDLASVELTSVTGDITLIGTLAPRGDLDIETFSGTVTVELPPNVRAEFEIETFSGEISNDFGPRSPVSERFEPYRTLEFSTGYDDYEIQISTHEGDITLRVDSEGSGS